MIRSLTARLLLAALVLSGLAVGAAPADAGTGDVMSLEWHTQDSSGDLVSQAADYTSYSAASSTAPGGARFSIPGSLKRVTVAPPAGARFVAGTTYAAKPTPDATNAQLLVDRNVFSTGLCPTSTSGSFAGTVTVLDAAYDDTGTLTELAADYQGTCTITSIPKAQETVAGSLRHSSAEPWLTLKPTYPRDVVPLTRDRVRPVTITATGLGGKTVRLGAAGIGGSRADDYSVEANHCDGAVLGDGESCQVDVDFAPLSYTNAANPRVAILAVAATGHVSDTLRVRLDSSSTELPAAADSLTTYPTAGGVGVTWRAGWPAGDQYRLDRRAAGEAVWTTVATLPYGGNPFNYVDHDTAAGQAVEFRVTGSNAGWDGDPATTGTTRPTDVPAAGPDSLVTYSTDDATAPRDVLVDGVDGTTVTASGGSWPAIVATAGPTTAHPSARVTYSVPMVPGPGEYRLSGGSTGSADASNVADGCNTPADAVLEVRSVAYDENRVPVVFDGSWVGRCPTGRVLRVEVRLGVDTPYALVSSDPAVVGRLTTYDGRSQTATVTVRDDGPGDLALHGASVTGSAAGDWQVTDDGCTGLTLHAGDTCPVTVRFSSTQDRARPAALELAASDATGPVAPVTVALDGFGATPPDAVVITSATGTIGAVLTWWSAPGDGGLPIRSYDVERRLSGTETWHAVASVPAGPHPSYVDTAVGTDSYEYQVRAVNEVGPGPWSSVGQGPVAAGTRAVVVSGSTSGTGPRGLFEVAPGKSQAPVIALTDDPLHDYRTPARSRTGSRLAVARSVGDGTDGEYDLWSGTFGDPTARRLTSMPGAERDPSYSPDGTQVAFTHLAPDGSRSVWVVAALGGDPREVHAAAGNPAWTDATHLLVEDDSVVDAPLLRVDVATGTGSPLPGTEAGTQPAVSWHGAVAYVDASGRILEVPAGQTQPQVEATPPYRSLYGSPAFDDSDRLVYDTTSTETGKTAGSLSYLLGDVREPSAALADTKAPWVSPAGLGEFVRGVADLDVRFGDYDETPLDGLHPACRLDGAAWQPCAGPVSYPHLTEGRHVLHLRVTDEAGHTTTNHVPFVSDTVPPTLTMTRPPLGDVLAGSAPFGWDGADAGSGPAFYEVRVRTATPTTGYTAYHLPKGWSSTDDNSWLRTHVAVGQELCVRVRVRDASGLWSGPATRCVARPTDDASLTASRGWHRVRASGLYRRTETDASRKGATLRTGRVTTRRVAVLATTCARCGAVKVTVGGRYVGTVSLRSARTRSRRLVRLPVLPRAVTGRVVLTTTSARPVLVDGLSLSRS